MSTLSIERIVEANFGDVRRFDRVTSDRVILDIEFYEWDFVVMKDSAGKSIVIRNVRVPVDQLWDMVDLQSKPSKAYLRDGTFIWVMRGRTDRDTGKYVELGAGNASEFVIAKRP